MYEAFSYKCLRVATLTGSQKEAPPRNERMGGCMPDISLFIFLEFPDDKNLEFFVPALINDALKSLVNVRESVSIRITGLRY